MASEPDDHRRPSQGHERTRLVVLYGGQSAEHEVSCVSALHVLRAAERSRYDVSLVGITTTGRWLDATPAIQSLEAWAASLPSPDSLVPCSLGAEDPTGAYLGAGSPGAGSQRPLPTTEPTEKGQDRPPALDPDSMAELARVLAGATIAAGENQAEVVVMPLLHGPKGEDGTVQGLLELAGVPYVGAGVLGSATAMDKGVAKSLLASAGIPQARHICLREREIDELLAKRVERELGWPVFVKPSNLGSSIGISRASDPSELANAIELALRYDEWLVIEEAISGREIEVAVICSDPPRVSVPGEIIPGHDFYDYADKYLDDTAILKIPADLPPGADEELRALAARACRALRVEGMARVDCFYEHDGRGWLLNEVNTIPGFTPISMYPRLWAACGVDYPALIDELVELARRRHRRRQTFDTKRPGSPAPEASTRPAAGTA